MFGGLANGDPGFPAYVEEKGFRYDMSALPQLQLFEEAGGNVGPMNCMQNDHGPATNRVMERSQNPEPFFMQQKLPISLNSNFCQDNGGRGAGSILNQNPVSTGLRLSYEEDERISSVTCGSENTKAIHSSTYPLSSNLQTAIDRQNELLEQYVKLQEGNLIKGVREMNQRHTSSLLNALEKRVGNKLHEKDVEIEKINSKNKELGDKIKQAAMEVQSWQYRAKYNESVVNVLKNNLQQVIALGAVQERREGYGESEVDDAASFCKNLENLGCDMQQQLMCRLCKGKEVSVLYLPCRHLCVCMECAGFAEACPVCQAVRTSAIQVFMS